MIKCVFNITLMMRDPCCCTSNRELVAIRKEERKKIGMIVLLCSIHSYVRTKGKAKFSSSFGLYTYECRLETGTTQSVCQSSSFVVRPNWNDEDRMVHVCVCCCPLIPIWNLIWSERVIWWRCTKEDDHCPIEKVRCLIRTYSRMQWSLTHVDNPFFRRRLINLWFCPLDTISVSFYVCRIASSRGPFKISDVVEIIFV